MVWIQIGIAIATFAAIAVAMGFLWLPLGLVFGFLGLLLSEELLIAQRSQQAPVTDWEKRRRELGY
jgi:hypothetical protein